MIHKNCGGQIALDDDAYRCQKCGRGYKCVGQEHYLDEVIERESRGNPECSSLVERAPVKGAAQVVQFHPSGPQAPIDRDTAFDEWLAGLNENDFAFNATKGALKEAWNACLMWHLLSSAGPTPAAKG
jgi:hypothetical protein